MMVRRKGGKYQIYAKDLLNNSKNIISQTIDHNRYSESHLRRRRRNMSLVNNSHQSNDQKEACTICLCPFDDPRILECAHVFWFFFLV